MTEVEYEGYVIKGDGTFGYVNIHPVGGRGSVPKPLKGSCSKVVDAQKAIDRVRDTDTKGGKNVKATSIG